MQYKWDTIKIIIISLYVVMVKLQCIFIKLKVMHHYLMTPFCFDTSRKERGRAVSLYIGVSVGVARLG